MFVFRCKTIINTFLFHSFHSKLKVVYMNGRMNKRIDGLLNILLEIERDECMDTMKKKYFGHRRRKDRERHKKGENISDDRIVAAGSAAVAR